MTMRVLYIEDETEMLDLVHLILARHGIEFFGVESGIIGLQQLDTLKPDLILLDLMMPEMDGWEVYHQLKTNDAWVNIPVLIVTARAQNDGRLQEIRLAPNVDDYIIKPFGPSQLMDIIGRVMARSKTTGD